jgi:hypothetical protein
MPSLAYHLKQAQIVARLARAEPDRVKAAQLNLLALEHFNKAQKARPNVDIDHTHSRAIVHEIGERLSLSLRVDPEIPVSLRMQLDRLRDLEVPTERVRLGR